MLNNHIVIYENEDSECSSDHQTNISTEHSDTAEVLYDSDYSQEPVEAKVTTLLDELLAQQPVSAPILLLQDQILHVNGVRN